MSVVVSEEPDVSMAEFEAVPISFRVETVLTPCSPPAGCVGMIFVEDPVNEPYTKEYDRPGNRPTDWKNSWDLSNWGFLTVREGAGLIGAAAVAWATPGVDLLEGRDDVSVLWDLRVVRARRGQGVGQALFAAAARWSRDRGVVAMKIETQSLNVTACRFYARQGCALAGIDTRAYPQISDEVQMMWVLEL